jgi:hypothetical protein
MPAITGGGKHALIGTSVTIFAEIKVKVSS